MICPTAPRRSALLVALALALGAAACGGGEPPDRSGASAPPSPASTAVAARTPSPSPPSPSPAASRPASARPTSPVAARPSTSTAPDPVPGWCLGKDVEVLPTTTRTVALTIDLGAGSQGLPAILSALAEQRVRATFFVTGAWLRGNPDGLGRIVAAGHVVGNHTDTHPALPTLSDLAVREQLATVEQLVRTATGRTTRPLFRFPFGERDARTIRLVNAEGYCAYRWTVDTLGWKGTGDGGSPERVVQRVLDTLRPGQIVLMHGGAHPQDGSTLDAEALPEVLRLLRERGYGFTTL